MFFSVVSRFYRPFLLRIATTRHIFVSFTDLGSSFWGMVLILASTNLLTARIAAGCFGVALFIVLFVAKNVSHVVFIDFLYLLDILSMLHMPGKIFSWASLGCNLSLALHTLGSSKSFDLLICCL